MSNASLVRLSALCQNEAPSENITSEENYPQNILWNWEDPLCLVVPELFMSTQESGDWIIPVSITAGFLLPIIAPYFLSCCLFGCTKSPQCKKFLQVTYYIIIHVLFWSSVVWLYVSNSRCQILVFQHCIPSSLQTINVCVVLMLIMNIILAWTYGCFINCHFHTQIIKINSKSVRHFLQQLENINPTITLKLTCHTMGRYCHTLPYLKKAMEKNVKFSVSRSNDHSGNACRIGMNSVVRVRVFAEPGDDNALEYLSWEKRHFADEHNYFIDTADFWEIADLPSVGDVKDNSIVCTVLPLWAKPHFQLFLALLGLDPINRFFEYLFRVDHCLVKKWYMDKRSADISMQVSPDFSHRGYLCRPSSLPVIHSMHNNYVGGGDSPQSMKTFRDVRCEVESVV